MIKDASVRDIESFFYEMSFKKKFFCERPAREAGMSFMLKYQQLNDCLSAHGSH